MSALKSFRRGKGRRYWIAGATLVAAAVFSVVFVAASGANLTGSTFEGNDGNMVVNTAGNTDWANVTKTTLTDLSNDPNDNSFTQGTAEDDQTVTIADGSIPPNKNDLTRAYISSEQVGNNSFLYLAWERLVNIGSANIDFELDQNATPGWTATTTGDVTINRTEGDLLITYDFSGSGTPTIGMLKWLTDNGTNTNTDCSKSGQKLPCWGDEITFAPSVAEAAVNTVNIQETELNTTLTPGLFGEAAINLSSALIAAGFNPDTCHQFGSVFVKSRSSGSSFDDELKDFIAPAPIQVSNCASPSIATQTSVSSMSVGETKTVGDTATLSNGNNPTGDVTFTLYSDANCTQSTGVTGTAPINAGVATFAGAPFTPASTGTYYWGVSYAGDNHNNPVSACGGQNEEIVVSAPSLSITKTADASPVNAGDDIGFTVDVSNAGPGTALDATLADPLPGGTATDWVIDPAYAGPGTCAINGPSGSQELDCSFGDLASGDSASVHVSSTTTFDHCTTYDNTATASASNSSDVQDSASIECQKPDLSVTKTADASPVNAGDDIGFTIDVSNGGPGTAVNATLADPLPGGTATDWVIDPAYAGPGTCAINGPSGNQELDCSFGDLASGDSASVHVSSTTTFDHCTKYDNTATASADNAPDAMDSASIECQKPDLAITKTADATTVDAGDPIGFTVDVTNNGPGTAVNASLADPLPGGTATDWVIDPAYAGPGTCAINGPAGNQELDCSFGDLASGDSASVHVSSSTSDRACTDYDNTATASADNAPDVSDSATIACRLVSLSISKTADAGTVNAGDPIGFTIDVTSNGPGTATNVTLADPLPGGTATDWVIDPAYAGPGTCAINGPSGSQELDCSFGDMAAQDTASVHVSSSTSFAACTDYDNTATASADNAPDASDSASIVCNVADVSITKTADHSTPVLAGGQIGFRVEVKNSGSGVASGVSLHDALPAGSGTGVTWAIDTATGTPARFVLSGAKGSQMLSLASSTLPAGADYTVHLVAATSASECGTYDNTATLTTRNANNPGPASASESCRLPQIDLAVTKAGSPATQTLGEGNITWTMVVTNNGPQAATGVTIADPMPAGNTFVSATTSQGSCTGGAILHCSIGNMAVGAHVTITLVTTPSAAGTQTNTVTVVGNEHETNTGNNSATATVAVTAPFTPPVTFCVAVSKVTPKQLFVGRKTTLRIRVTKHGKAVKGVHVRIKGPKINMRTKASNSKGVITARVKMKKAGIVIFSPIASKRCNTKRVGVTGVFTPPVTG
jgi:uncharacterized repeat protein (TIGR01451 family)